MHRSLAALLFAAGVGLAQAPAPPAAPLDLEARAAQLDPGELPSVLAALPAERVDRLRRLATLLTEAVSPPYGNGVPASSPTQPGRALVADLDGDGRAEIPRPAGTA